jgi:hypothetical protein
MSLHMPGSAGAGEMEARQGLQTGGTGATAVVHVLERGEPE